MGADCQGGEYQSRVREKRRRQSEIKTIFAQFSAETTVGPPQDFAAFIAAEVPKWAALVKASRQNRLTNRKAVCGTRRGRGRDADPGHPSIPLISLSKMNTAG
jgi:hypothetical protein